MELYSQKIGDVRAGTGSCFQAHPGLVGHHRRALVVCVVDQEQWATDQLPFSWAI